MKEFERIWGQIVMDRRQDQCIVKTVLSLVFSVFIFGIKQLKFNKMDL